MVGRDRELARVMLLLDALAGSGRLVLAWGRVADGGSLPPYGLWRLVLDEPAVRAADDDPSGASLWSRVFGDAGRPALADGADSGSAWRCRSLTDRWSMAHSLQPVRVSWGRWISQA